MENHWSLPKDWEWRKLGDMSEVVSKGTTPTTYGNSFSSIGIPFLRAEDVVGEAVNPSTVKYCIDEKTHQTTLGRSQLKPGDFLITIAGSLGRVGYIPANAPAMNCNQAVAFVRLNPNIIDINYLLFVFQYERITSQLLDNQKIGTIGNLNLEQIRDFEIPLPPPTEQRRITELLSRANRLRQVRTFNDSLSASILPSVFLKMFGDPIQNPKGWDRVEINDLISDLRGGSPLEPEDFIDKGFPVLHKGAIKPYGVIELDSRKKTFTHESFVKKYQRAVVNRDYVAVTLRDLVPSGPSIGLVSALRNSPYPEYILAQGAYAFLVDKERVTPEYLMCLSNIPSFRNFLRSQSVGSTQIHIRTPIYTEIAIPVPPLPEQEEFATVVQRVESLRARAGESARQGEELFQALLAQSFSEKA